MLSQLWLKLPEGNTWGKDAGKGYMCIFWGKDDMCICDVLANLQFLADVSVSVFSFNSTGTKIASVHSPFSFMNQVESIFIL